MKTTKLAIIFFLLVLKLQALHSEESSKQDSLVELYKSKQYLLFKKQTLKADVDLTDLINVLTSESYPMWGEQGLIGQIKKLNSSSIESVNTIHPGTELVIPFIPKRSENNMSVFVFNWDEADPLPSLKEGILLSEKTETYQVKKGDVLSNVCAKKVGDF